MAYTYLDITNEVLARMNEVALTSANFTAARGFQVQCKNAVNEAIRYINQREFGDEKLGLLPGEDRTASVGSTIVVERGVQDHRCGDSTGERSAEVVRHVLNERAA